ncbi:MAG: thioredoxin-like domain-containing protein, partial [Acidimicrobiales bacterium]
MPIAHRVPELVGRGGWIGTADGFTMAALRGRVVVLFFWADGDVASLRVAEELRRLDHRHAEDVVVIGVHTARFPGTDHTDVVTATARQRPAYPVLDDPEAATASAFGVGSWPTVVLVDQRGRRHDSFVGEGHAVSLGQAVTDLLEADPRRRRHLAIPAPPTVPEPLAFPSKVAVSADGRRLAIADTGHDRVVVCTLDGLVLAVYTGFVRPNGVRFDGRGVVVCDTVPGRIVRSNGEVLADAIASPWDLVSAGDGSWVVAEAGGHRLVRVRPGEISTRVAAGTGAEGHLDGPDVQAELSQPMGVARTAEGIVFTDAGTGALRRLRRDRRRGDVTTLSAGAMLAPAGVAASPDGGPVFVADTRNSRLLRFDGESLAVLDVAGLDHPGGLDLLADGRLVVADTDNHRVVVVDPATGAVQAVELDETWVHAVDGTPFSAAAGEALSVPVALDLVDEALEPPLQVTVEARPRQLLDGGPRRVELDGTTGTVELRAGRPGTGLVLVE